MANLRERLSFLWIQNTISVSAIQESNSHLWQIKSEPDERGWKKYIRRRGGGGGDGNEDAEQTRGKKKRGIVHLYDDLDP